MQKLFKKTKNSFYSQSKKAGQDLYKTFTRSPAFGQKYPGKLKSYKYQIYPDMLDNKVSIVCFHGRPSIIQAMSESVTTPMATYHPQKWIQDYWR